MIFATHWVPELVIGTFDFGSLSQKKSRVWLEWMGKFRVLMAKTVSFLKLLVLGGGSWSHYCGHHPNAYGPSGSNPSSRFLLSGQIGVSYTWLYPLNFVYG